MDKFKKSLKLFFCVLRLCGLNAIDLDGKRPTKKTQVSKLWTTYSILVLISYGYFHIATVQFDLKTTATGANFVTTLIDYYNKYSGLVLFVTSILVTLARQKGLCEFLDILQDHDDVLLTKLSMEREINYAREGR